MSPNAVVPPAAAAVKDTVKDTAKKPRVAKPRLSFMLHDPVTFASLGK